MYFYSSSQPRSNRAVRFLGWHILQYLEIVYEWTDIF